MKRGRKPGQINSYCKLPHCKRCDIRLTDSNGYKKSNGKYFRFCKTCNNLEQIKKRLQTLNVNELYAEMAKDYQHIALIKEVLIELTTNTGGF